jgi:WD40 repeat protein/tetratricopeptide (TPR) repeat protein
MNSGSRRNVDLHLADVLSEQAGKERPQELIAEVEKDFGDRRALAHEFDRAFARAVAQDRKRLIVDFFGGMSNWKPIAITAVVTIVAAGSALFWLSHSRRDAEWRLTQSDMNTRVSSELAAIRNADLDAAQSYFEQMRSAGDLAAAKDLAERYLLLAKTQSGEDHPSYAKGLYELATVNEELGSYREAEPLYLRAIAITEKALGPEHPSLATALNGLASVYEAQERLREAQSIYQRSLAIAEKALGTSHPDAADTRAKLAKVEARLLAPGKPTRMQFSATAQHAPLVWILMGHGDAVEQSAFSPDGRRLVTASQSTVRVWDVESGRATDEFPSRSAPLLSLVFDADGRITTTYADRTLLNWAPGRPLLVESLPAWPGRTLAVASDGRQLVADNNTVKLLSGTNEIAAFGGHAGPIAGAAFDPGGTRILVVSNDKTIRVWDAVTARPLSVLRSRTSPMQAAFSPDGTKIVSIGKDDSSAYIWNSATGLQTAVLTGHQGPVLNAAFSPDGRQLATASMDGTARLWNGLNHTAIGILQGHKAAVTSATFSPDGRLVATTSEDRTARLWRVRGDDLVDVQADSVTYGSDDRITFQGGVEFYFGLFILTADRVIYDAKSQTLVADGNVVTRNPDGTRTQIDRLVLPAEVRDEFVRSLSTTVRDSQQPRKTPNQQQ